MAKLKQQEVERGFERFRKFTKIVDSAGNWANITVAGVMNFTVAALEEYETSNLSTAGKWNYEVASFCIIIGKGEWFLEDAALSPTDGNLYHASYPNLIRLEPLEDIYVHGVDDAQQLIHVLGDIQAFIAIDHTRLPVKLIVIDSIAAFFRSQYQTTPADLKQ
ncbi:unnamed protein product [Prunus armeniaca]